MVAAMTLISALVLCVAAIGAGAMNALAGGGSFITFPALLFTGLDPRAANITSTIALFPGQIVTGWAGRRYVAGAGGLSFAALFVISLVGGVLGAFLLLATPASFFARLVPWLVLFATGVFAWGSFFRRTPARAMALPRQVAGGLQLLIAIYGGYFGGGIGFLMLAVLTAVGLSVRNAGATKNVLASCMNAAAALVFVFAPGVGWLQVLILSVGSAIGGWIGAWLLQRVNEKLLRLFVITVGAALTVGLFLRG
jgi:uncharacterized membrane protein YfcA